METLLISIGVIGALIQLGTYALVAAQKLNSNEARFYWLNLLGTCCITLSLMVQWNMPSFVAQTLWIVVSLVGLVRVLKARKI